MKVAFRADASLQIGSGHLMRCLTLADQLRQRGAEVMFVCREHPGHLIALTEAKGYRVARLPQAESGYTASPEDVAHAAWLVTSWHRDAADTLAAISGLPIDWLIIDHYALDRRWEQTLRPQVGRITVIDDLADRPHDCELLLDQNLFEDMRQRYHGLAPPGCRLFLGPRYALLRDEFIRARRTLRRRDGIVRRILLFFGGSDATNETEKALLALKELDFPELAVDVVVGGANPHGIHIQEVCAATPNLNFHRQVANMAELMVQADLAIGAGGGTTWERCFLGLPTLTVAVADNQLLPARAADAAGLAFFLGVSTEVTAASLATAVGRAVASPERLAEVAERCLVFMGERNAPVHDDMLNSLCEVADAP